MLVFTSAIICPALTRPSNGSLSYDGALLDGNDNYPFNSTATYSCNIRFSLVGDSDRRCTGDGSNVTGAFSGKDPSKVDRSGAYAGRYVAKNLVAAGIAERCEIQVSYAIGVAEPTSISVETFGTGKLEESRIIELIREHFDLRPRGIIEMLDLLKPRYRSTAAYGHFGREEELFTWERTDKADALRDAAGL